MELSFYPVLLNTSSSLLLPFRFLFPLLFSLILLFPSGQARPVPARQRAPSSCETPLPSILPNTFPFYPFLHFFFFIFSKQFFRFLSVFFLCRHDPSLLVSVGTAGTVKLWDAAAALELRGATAGASKSCVATWKVPGPTAGMAMCGHVCYVAEKTVVTAIDLRRCAQSRLHLVYRLKIDSRHAARNAAENFWSRHCGWSKAPLAVFKAE